MSNPVILWISLVLYGIVFLVGFIGNSLVIYVVLRYSKMQTVTNFYILNLAIADVTFLAGLPFLMFTMYYKSWRFGYEMCKIYMTSTSVNQYTSSMLLTILSADRYLAVCHPIAATNLRTPNISKVVALTGWMVSALLILPIFMYANTVPSPRGLNCNIVWPEFYYGLPIFTIYSFFAAFAVPTSLIMVFYCMVVQKLKTVGPRQKSEEKKKSHRRVTRLVLTVVTVYVLCWLPYWIIQMQIFIFAPGPGLGHVLTNLSVLSGILTYCNSALNPVMYAFLSDNFKKSFMKACVCAQRSEVNKILQAEQSQLSRKRSEKLSRARSLNASTRRDVLMINEKTPNDVSNTGTSTGTMTTYIPLDNGETK
ncbi:somatostatin receptor type 2-like [Artemia franciscana]